MFNKILLIFIFYLQTIKMLLILIKVVMREQHATNSIVRTRLITKIKC